MRSSRLTVAGGAVAVALASAGVVGAFWTVGSDPGGNGHASIGSLPVAATPTTLLVGRDATVSWAQSTVLGSPLGQLAGGGYAITRYAEGDPSAPIATGGSCAGVVPGASDPISCAELSLPTGRWRYTATPVLYSWLGGESPQSASVAIVPDAPLSVALTNGSGTGNAYISAANQASLTFDVALPSTSLASDTLTLSLADGTATVTATDAGIDGGGTRTFTGVDASGLADGSIIVSASVMSSDGDSSSSTSITRTKDTVVPALSTLTMRDNNANGKVERTLATFSEALAAYSAGTVPWSLADVPSGGSLSSVSVSGVTATLTIVEGAGAPDTAVDSFTVSLATNATGIRDPAGNLASFAASTPADGAKPVLVAGTLVMRDVDDNGKVDRTLATFSETLAASSDTAPWTLTNIPSAGSLASVSTTGASATLSISEGAGAQNTAVGSFRVALAASASGIRDAAGNLSSFGASSPLDGAKPVPVGVTSTNNGVTAGLMEPGDTFAVTFSETIASPVGPAAAITQTDPSGAGNDTLTIGGLTAVAGVVTGSNLYILTDSTSATFSTSTVSKAGAVVTATVAGTCSGICGVNITAGIGALVFAPDPTLQDAAGNAAAGSFTTASTFRLF